MFKSFRSDKAGPWIIASAVTFSLVYFISIGAIYSYVHQSVYYEHSTSKEKATRQNKFEKKCSSILSVEELRSCFKSQIETSGKEQRAQEDLYAQKQMADWAFWMFVVTFAVGVPGLALTVVGIILIYLNLKEARSITAQAIRSADAAHKAVKEGRKTTKAANRAADIQENAFKRLERPYLFIEFAEIKLSGRQSLPLVKYEIANRGKTPAILRYVYIRLAHSDKMYDQTVKSGMPRVRAIPKKREDYEVIAPNASAKRQTVYVEGAQPGDNWQEGKKAMDLVLHAVMSYEDAAGNFHHESILMRGEEGGNSFIIVKRITGNDDPDAKSED